MEKFHQQLGRPPPSSLDFEDVRSPSTPSSEVHENQLLKQEVAVLKSAHNEILKAMAILESKNYELQQMLQNDIHTLRNEVTQFENETLHHQKKVQMEEPSTIPQMQGVRDGSNDAEKSRLKQTIAELMTTVDMQHKTIADMESKQDVDRQSFDTVTTVLESDIAALKQHIARLQSPYKVVLNIIDKAGDSPLSEEIKRVAINNFIEEMENCEPLVIKKLFKLQQGASWHGYSTLNENEIPIKIRCDDNNNLLLDDVKSNKILILNGVISYFDSDPWSGNAGFVKNDALVFPGLLHNVVVWNIADLFLHWKNLRWDTFKMVAASGSIKNLYFSDVWITHTNNALIPLENILEMLPNIEKFRCDVIVGNKFSNVNKETSKNLVRLPCFKSLKVFQLFNIVPTHFDHFGFLVFMKKHPNAHFTLSFRSSSWREKVYLWTVKNQMLKLSPYPKMLKFKY